ncbi:MAG: efflux RND transporter periplasmic adaptor subunit, partial [Acidobacteriota bacterium]
MTTEAGTLGETSMHGTRSIRSTRRTRSVVPSLLPILIPILTLAVLTGCGGGEPDAAAPGSAAESTAAGPAPVPVRTAVAAYRPIGSRSVVTGAVEPWRRTTTGSKIMGRAERVPVHEGERVERGALLVTLESRDLQAAVRQAEAAVTGAEAQLENARAQYERMGELHAKGSATEKSLEDATAGFRMAEAGLAQAEANLEAARVTLGYAEVRSPFAGWVVDRRVEAGDMVRPGAPLFVVEDLDPVKVIAEVPETEISGFAPGDRVTVEVTAVGYGEQGEI